MNGSDTIVSMLYIKKDVLESSTKYFYTGKSESKENENIKERITDFKYSKEEFGKYKTKCNVI